MTFAQPGGRALPGGDSLPDRLEHIPVRLPYAYQQMARFLADHAVAGVESWDGRWYTRTLRLPAGPAVLAIDLSGQSATQGIPVRLRVCAEQDRPAALAAAHRIVDADFDPDELLDALGADPVLGTLVSGNPGLRVTGAPDLFEAVVRAIAGQQVSVSGARTVLGRLVARFGADLGGGRWQFPEPEELAGAQTIDMAMPRTRANAIIGFAAEVASGRLDLSDPVAAVAGLRAARGIGPWTVDYVSLRALHDRDIMLATDVGVRRGLRNLGWGDDVRTSNALAAGWRPWRSYAVAHLWEAAGPAQTARSEDRK